MIDENKTSKEDFSQASNPREPGIKIDYTHEDLAKRLDVQEKLAKHGGDMKFIAELREEYVEKQDKNWQNRIQQNEHFKQGKEIGLHQQSDKEKVNSNREQEDQNFRNKMMDKATEYYNENQSISREFEKGIDKDDPKEK